VTTFRGGFRTLLQIHIFLYRKRNIADKTDIEKILLKDLKFSWIQIRKVILLNYQNNYVERSNQLPKYQNFLQYCKIYCLLLLRFQQNYFQICIQQNRFFLCTIMQDSFIYWYFVNYINKFFDKKNFISLICEDTFKKYHL